MAIMRGITLESFLFLFILKSIIAMGNAYPITDSDEEDFLKINSITKGTSAFVNNAAASNTPYTCVYVPPELDLCTFTSYQDVNENILNKLASNKMLKLLQNNNKHLMLHPMHNPKTEQFLKQKSVKTIIYEIQKCLPSRLPFTLPWCTDEDLLDKKREIWWLVPYPAENKFKIKPHKSSINNFSKLTSTVSKSI